MSIDAVQAGGIEAHLCRRYFHLQVRHADASSSDRFNVKPTLLGHSPRFPCWIGSARATTTGIHARSASSVAWVGIADSQTGSRKTASHREHAGLKKRANWQPWEGFLS